MNDEKIKYPIRSALIPVFYQNFHCLAQDCQDTCCMHWRITFSKKDYLRLRRLDVPAEFRERLEKTVRRERKGGHDGIFYAKIELDPKTGRCPLQEPGGLCGLQRACGAEALPDVCQTYPRKRLYTPAAKEYSLSPSCEGVLQQLWDLPDGVDFVEDPLPRTEWRDVNILPGDSLMLYFAPLRGLFIDVLQDRSMPLTERMLYLGVLVQRLQKEDWDSFDADAWVEAVQAQGSAGVVKELAGLPGNRRIFLMQNLNVLAKISIEDRTWPIDVCRALGASTTIHIDMTDGKSENYYTGRFSEAAYADALAQFQEAFPDVEYFFENLMVASALYLVFPKLASREALWKSYVSLCSLYSLFRLVAVAGCKENATKERLFHMIVMASRATLHDRDRFDGFQEELFKHDSTTLAHMAILLRWN